MWFRRFAPLSIFLFIVLLVSATHGLAQGETVRFVDGEGKTLDEIEGKLHENVVYLPVTTLKTVFDKNTTHSYHRPRKQLTINAKGKEIQVRMDNTLVSIDSGKQTITITVPPRLIQEQPMLPISFFEMVLPELDDVQVIYKPELKRVRIMDKTILTVDASDANTDWTIIIDPGHGGEDDRGCKSQNGLFEKDVVLAVAKEIQSLSIQHGFAIHLTREQDVKKTREQRFQIANRFQGKLFLSLHCNASFSQKHKGIRLYLNNPNGHLRFRTAPMPIFDKKSLNIRTQANFLNQSKYFASILQRELNFVAKEPIVLSEFPIITLKDVYMPAILIELGYLSNLEDATKLAKHDHISELAQIIVRAIQLYMDKVHQSTKPNGVTPEESSDQDER